MLLICLNNLKKGVIIMHQPNNNSQGLFYRDIELEIKSTEIDRI